MKIAINKDTTDPNKSGRLIVELTIDGAKELDEKGFIEDMDTEHYKFSPDHLSIHTAAVIDWETPKEQIVDSYVVDTSISITEEWKENPKHIFHFYPDKENKDRFKEVSAKIAATAWATHSQEPIDVASINVGQRHNLVAIAYSKVDEAKHAFKYDQYKQDDKYYSMLKDLSAEMDKELDFLQAKMKLMKVVSGNFFGSTKKVSEAYREFRGVEKMGELEISTDVNKPE